MTKMPLFCCCNREVAYRTFSNHDPCACYHPLFVFNRGTRAVGAFPTGNRRSTRRGQAPAARPEKRE